MKKKPKVSAKDDPGKRPKRQPRIAQDADNSTAKPPIWRLHVIDHGGPFRWELTATKLREVVQKMASFETNTWADLGGQQHHLLSPDSLSREALRRLEEIKHEDAADQLFSFRLGAKERVIGIRAGREFWVLWWDPEHRVCPSHKKHT